MRPAAIAILLGLAALGCEETYRECHVDRAPEGFPADEDRTAQCLAVCEHLDAIGCHLGCPYLPEAGLDGGVQTTDLDCVTSCVAAVDGVSHPEVSPDAVSRALRCYSGAETCRQVGACSRLCGDDDGRVWPTHFQCVPETF